MRVDYRNYARNSLKRAQNELNSKDNNRLPYVALELRIAIECLVYERAEIFKSELPNDFFNTWQPRQLLDQLIEIEPAVDKGCALSVGTEDIPGILAKTMQPIGKERVLSLKEIKKYYARLGSYLHMPTLGQLESGEITGPEQIQQRCKEVFSIIEEVLASSIFRVDFKIISSIDSCLRCNKKVIGRLPFGKETVKVICKQCEAPYIVTSKNQHESVWTPDKIDIKCANKECSASISLWRDEIKVGTEYPCGNCKKVNRIALGVIICEPQNDKIIKK